VPYLSALEVCSREGAKQIHVYRFRLPLERLMLLSLIVHTYMYTVDVGVNYVSRNVATTKRDN